VGDEGEFAEGAGNGDGGTVGRSAGMNREEVRDLVNGAIREHEIRVALWSGLLGAALMAGTWHAIWMCR
jgi:hypothetical protein